ncbi:MAG: hypothetical protein JWM20_589 [Patescibacteria group bacterium]|nr:hypothetical protein [Patescibacteria group bacterium]
MKSNLILTVAVIAALVVAIACLLGEIDYAYHKARIVAERTIDQRGVYGALNDMPYVASSHISFLCSKEKWNEQQLREAVANRYARAENNYYRINSAYWILIWLFANIILYLSVSALQNALVLSGKRGFSNLFMQERVPRLIYLNGFIALVWFLYSVFGPYI